jgi:hypothetical protein
MADWRKNLTQITMARFLNTSTIKSFQTNVSTAGTPVQLPSYSVPEGISVVVKAKTSNTSAITIGGSSSEALHTGTSFFSLLPGQAIEYQVTNTNHIWIDAYTNGDGVEVTLEY